MDEKIKVNNFIDNSEMIAVTCDIADMIMDAKYQGDPNLYMTIVDDEGTTEFLPEAQEVFNRLYDEVQDLIAKAFNIQFIEDVYEIAFGDNAINKGYTEQEVLNKLKEFSDNSLEN